MGMHKGENREKEHSLHPAECPNPRRYRPFLSPVRENLHLSIAVLYVAPSLLAAPRGGSAGAPGRRTGSCGARMRKFSNGVGFRAQQSLHRTLSVVKDTGFW